MARTATPTVSNRQTFSQSLAKWADEPPLSVALIDVDEFKSINDRYGFAVGDKFLNAIASGLKAAADHVVRTGGDEFACALPATTPERALLAIEAARAKLFEQGITAGRTKLPVSFSAGIASLPQHAEDASELITAADEALNRSKREGRGRVSIWVEDKMVLKSNYYPRAQLDGLARLARRMETTEASLLREALRDLLEKHRDAG